MGTECASPAQSPLLLAGSKPGAGALPAHPIGQSNFLQDLQTLAYSLLTATFIWEHDLNLLVFLSLNKEQQQPTIYNLAKLKGKAKKYN